MVEPFTFAFLIGLLPLLSIGDANHRWIKYPLPCCFLIIHIIGITTEIIHNLPAHLIIIKYMIEIMQLFHLSFINSVTVPIKLSFINDMD